jgi:hypothetical protein
MVLLLFSYFSKLLLNSCDYMDPTRGTYRSNDDFEKWENEKRRENFTKVPKLPCILIILLKVHKF